MATITIRLTLNMGYKSKNSLMVYVVVMNYLIDFPLLTHIEFL
jgi:hypothetical protein